MPSKKRQHYVPKFYLRNFASDKEQRTINIYTLKASKFISNASLRDQCYKDYYYGKDGKIEKAFEKIEGPISQVFDNIIKGNQLPNRFSPEHSLLISYVVLQIVRTENAEMEVNYTVDQLVKKLYAKELEEEGILNDKVTINDFSIKLTDPMRLLFSSAANAPIAMDLNYKVFRDKSNTGFITSDNPTVRYNQLFQHKKNEGDKTGLATTGLQIFLPISPSHCLIFYDEKAYRIGNRKDAIVPITRSENVDQINGLQITTC